MTFTRTTNQNRIRKPDHQTAHSFDPACRTTCTTVDEHPTLPYVYAFATVMEQKFHENRHKGNREGWMAMTPSTLWERMGEEMKELHQALLDWYRCPCVDHARAVAREAADVANYGLEIADRVDGLP